MKITVHLLEGCGRCGGNHEHLEFLRLGRPILRFDFWALCPTRGEPVLLRSPLLRPGDADVHDP